MQIVVALDYKNAVLHLYCIAKTPDQDGRSPEGLVNEPLLFDPRKSCFAGLSLHPENRRALAQRMLSRLPFMQSSPSFAKISYYFRSVQDD
jgi:hypothetical protein